MIFGMEKQRAFKLIAVCSIAMALQGCIAAAFPLAAGGLMASGERVVPGTETGSEGDAAAAARASAGEALETSNVAAPIDTAVELVKAETVAETFAEFAAEEQTPATITVPSATASERAVALTESVAAPPSAAPADTSFAAAPPVSTANASSAASSISASSSSMVIPIPSAAPAVAGGTFFDPLFVYAAEPEFAVSGARNSATLLDPTALEPDRIECTQGESTVLIDLDPEEGELLPVDTDSASPAFSQRLAELRVRGLVIAWISRSPAEKAADIRTALFQSGLDPLGADELLLIRNSDERKQTRRDELARNSCLIAIAGDTRSDFHELFDYLLNASDAAALEPLIGEGWFLIPTPLLAERSAP